MNAHLFCIECLTNLHVGSGESNYNIIDNEVERDPVMKNVPVIHASGVKGALRAHFHPEKDKKLIEHVFGMPSKKDDDKNDDDNQKKNDTLTGAYKFFTANLLVRPLRIFKGPQSYVLAATPEIFDHCENLAKALGDDLSFEKETAEEPIFVEGLVDGAKQTVHASRDLFGKNQVVEVDSFEPYDLPVLARNKLNNGKSVHLWYEEIVPHQSRFYFFVLVPDSDTYIKEFTQRITNGWVQFGGNASIGYGYCKVTEVLQ